MEKEVLTTEEAAEYLRLHPKTVRRLIREGEIPAVKVGREWRILKGSLDEYLRRNNK